MQPNEEKKLPGVQSGGGSPPDLEFARSAPVANGDPVARWVESTLAEAAQGTVPPVLSPATAAAAAAAAAAVTTAVPQPVRTKTKGMVKKVPPAAQRKWLEIDSTGTAAMVSLNRTQLTQALGIQVRDLRLLDPKLATSYPSAILCRDHSLVVNLEFIKMIVGLDRCYITNLDDESTTTFVSELQRRIKAAYQGMPATKSTMDLSTAEGTQQPSGTVGFDELPFELRVLEVALDVVSGYLERLTCDLEASAHPALDALTVNITTDNLERVRRMKTRMVRLNTRVETLREVLEKFLDDDGDMRDMNLSAKEAREQEREAEAIRRGSVQPFDVVLPATGTKTPGSPGSAAMTYDTDEEEEEAVEVVEQLLESYFMQVDNTWNKLQTLTEYIDDTEDYINIQLDSQRNQLIRLDLILTCFTASMALITAITSLFAMNAVLSPQYPDKLPFWWFLIVAIVSAVSAIGMFSLVVGYARWKRLI